MKSPLAKARDEWLLSDEGKRCCFGTATGRYLQNRLELAFLAGANFSAERIKELEELLFAYESVRAPINPLFPRIKQLEKKIIDIATYANGLENAQNFIEKRFKDLEAETQEVSNQLMDLYTDCADSTEPKVYGTILGLHERFEKFLKG